MHTLRMINESFLHAVNVPLLPQFSWFCCLFFSRTARGSRVHTDAEPAKADRESSSIVLFGNYIHGKCPQHKAESSVVHRHHSGNLIGGHGAHITTTSFRAFEMPDKRLKVNLHSGRTNDGRWTEEESTDTEFEEHEADVISGILCRKT